MYTTTAHPRDDDDRDAIHVYIYIFTASKFDSSKFHGPYPTTVYQTEPWLTLTSVGTPLFTANSVHKSNIYTRAFVRARGVARMSE